jgi:hypothetical protein
MTFKTKILIKKIKNFTIDFGPVLNQLKKETSLVTEGISTIGTNTQTESVQQAFQAEDLSFLSNAANTIAKHPDLTDLFVTALNKSSQM